MKAKRSERSVRRDPCRRPELGRRVPPRRTLRQRRPLRGASSWTGRIRSLALLRLFGRNTELGVRQHSAVWNTRAHTIGDPCRRGFLETPSPRHAGTEFTLVALGLAPVPCQPGPGTRPTKEMNLPRPAHTRPPSPLCPGTRPPSHRGGARPPVEDSDFRGALAGRGAGLAGTGSTRNPSAWARSPLAILASGRSEPEAGPAAGGNDCVACSPRLPEAGV